MLNPELGDRGRSGRAVTRRSATQAMGHILDIVPNHMAASHENPALGGRPGDGPASRYARWFDIDVARVRARPAQPGATAGARRPPGAVLAARRDRSRRVRPRGLPRSRYFDHGSRSTRPPAGGLRQRAGRVPERLGRRPPAAPRESEAIDRCYGACPAALARAPTRSRSGAAAPPMRSTALQDLRPGPRGCARDRGRRRGLRTGPHGPAADRPAARSPGLSAGVLAAAAARSTTAGSST